MEENKENENENTSAGWLSHSLIAAAAVIVLVVLLVLQPWSDSLRTTITSVESCRLVVSAVVMGRMGIYESNQEMSYMAPDSFRTLSIVGDERHEMIVIGSNLYANDESHFSGVYAVMAVSRGLAGMVPGKAHTQMSLEQLANMEELKTDIVDGVTCRHYRGVIDYAKNIEEQIAELDPEEPGYEQFVDILESQIESMQLIETNIEIWVGIDDGLVRQMIYQIQIPPEHDDGPASSNMFLKYSDFNMPVNIVAPLDSNGKLLPGWYQAMTSE